MNQLNKYIEQKKKEFEHKNKDHLYYLDVAGYDIEHYQIPKYELEKAFEQTILDTVSMVEKEVMLGFENRPAKKGVTKQELSNKFNKLKDIE